MAGENGTTLGQALQETDPAKLSEYTGDTAPDTIKGWNDRRKSNNQVISGLVPFVQLIGLFNTEEYEKMVGGAALDRRDVEFIDAGGHDVPVNKPYTVQQPEGESFVEWMERKLRDRFINIYLVEQIDMGLSVAPRNGIVMAETVSQVNDFSGGVGITDLQIDYGKSNIMGSRKFVMRMTVNDPKFLDDRPEYAKLAAMGGEYVIIYGWANPKSIPGYSAAIAPPQLEQDPTSDRQMMVIPTRNLGNGGYWSAGKVEVNTYDFSFNEMGKLEISVTLRDRATTGLVSTRVSSIAPIFKKLMGTGDGTDDKNFIHMVIKNSQGGAITIKDQVLLEQQRLMQGDGNLSAEEAAVATSSMPAGNVEIASLGGKNKPLSEALEELSGTSLSYYENAGAASNLQSLELKQQSEALGFPNALGISTYEKTKRHIKIATNAALDTEEGVDSGTDADDANPEDGYEHVTIDDYKVKTVFYYLGWVMEGVRLSLSEANRGREVEGEPIFNPKFFYTDNSSDSQLTTAFQRTIPSTSRRSSMEERIQEAVLRLKERCMPPAPRMRGPTPAMYNRIHDVYDDYGIDLFNEDKKVIPCGGTIELEGPEIPLSRSIVNAIFPKPAGMTLLMAEVPHRGFLLTIDPLHDEYRLILDRAVKDDKLDKDWAKHLPNGNHDAGLRKGRPRRLITFFKPDWYALEEPGAQVFTQFTRWEDVDENRVGQVDTAGMISSPVGGSPQGYNPNNPTDYMAQDRGGRFFYKVGYTLGGNRTRAETLAIAKSGFAGMISKWNIIMTVNDYRSNDPEIWEMTQRRWHNLYIRFLATHFERLIRIRMQELAEESRTVEEIYDEPVDLDFLTGRVFNNHKFNADWVGGKWSQGWFLDPYDPKPDGDLVDYITGLEAKQVEHQNSVNKANEKLTELSNNGAAIVAVLNDIRNKIEDVCGGEYERVLLTPTERYRAAMEGKSEKGAPISIDMLGNPILENFKNFAYVIRGDIWPAKSGYERMAATSWQPAKIDVFYPREVYVRGEGPRVTLDWIIWKKFQFDVAPPFGTKQVPTDNFNWASYADDNTNINRDDGGSNWGETRVGHNVDDSNLQARWKQQYPAEYERAQQMRDEREAELKILLGQEMVQVKKLERLYIQHSEWINNREINENIIANIQRNNEQYTQLYNEEGRLRELSPYDDTSDIDVPIEIDMGREHPMVLTTKVAFQFYKRLKRSCGMRGVIDVTNYGPPKGGLKYQRPSNTYEFKYKPERNGHSIVTSPKMILDPITVNHIFSQVTNSKWRRKVFRHLDIGAEDGDQDIENSKTGLTYDKEFPSGQPEWIHWGAFGTPGTPNEDGRNEYGFKKGPPHERDAEGKTGGTNVSDYGEFLDLFGLHYNPKFIGVLKIKGKWPSPEDTDLDDFGEPLMAFTMIDAYNNIIKPDGFGWFVTTGWVLDYGGPPVYLYPDIDRAVRIETKTGPGFNTGAVLQTGYGVAAPHFSTHNGIHRGSDDQGNAFATFAQGGNKHNDHGNRNWIDEDGLWGPDYSGKTWGGGDKAAAVGDDYAELTYTKWAKIQMDEAIEKRNKLRDAMRGALRGGAVGTFIPGIGTFGGAVIGAVGGFFGWGDNSRPNLTKPATSYTNEAGQPYSAFGHPTWGPRIGNGEHNLNLTIDEKRALVIRRAPTKKKFRTLGKDMPAPWWGIEKNLDVVFGDKSPGNGKPGQWNPIVSNKVIGPGVDTDRMKDNWNVITKTDGRWYYNVNYPERNKKKGDPIDTDEKGHGIWPKIPKTSPYSNKDYPYGTGFYKNRPGKGDNDKAYGSWCYPQRSPNKNYMYWGDFLVGLPGMGFFTNINNNNNSPTKILPDGTIVDGEEINVGLVQFIIQNVIAPIGKNRRIANRNNMEAPNIRSGNSSGKRGSRLSDVTYGALFAPMPDEEESNQKGRNISFADLTNLKIDNVADIPIRRDVVDNLMNKNNNSMSIASFFSEIFKPESIGIQTANVNVGARQRGDGTFEIFQANKNWDQIARQMMKEYDDETQFLPDRYPSNFMLFDYRSSDSLIQNIDMSSKFDPMIGMTFQHGAEAWTGNADKLATFLSYGNVAKDLQVFLKTENEADYDGIVEVEEGTEKVKVNLKKLLGDANDGNGKVVPTSVITKFLMLKPERMQKLNAMIQSTPGSNFATQLMSQYMRKTTITIHGTTMVYPFQKILIRGIMPELEGVYLVTNTRESVTPQDFQTIIDAVLIKPVSQVSTQTQADAERR